MVARLKENFPICQNLKDTEFWSLTYISDHARLLKRIRVCSAGCHRNHWPLSFCSSVFADSWNNPPNPTFFPSQTKRTYFLSILIFLLINSLFTFPLLLSFQENHRIPHKQPKLVQKKSKQTTKAVQKFKHSITCFVFCFRLMYVMP